MSQYFFDGELKNRIVGGDDIRCHVSFIFFLEARMVVSHVFVDRTGSKKLHIAEALVTWRGEILHFASVALPDAPVLLFEEGLSAEGVF